MSNTLNTYKTIWILGGMGPEATYKVYEYIVNIFQRERWAVHDADFPQIIINSIPVPDMVSGSWLENTYIYQCLKSWINVLKNAGADCIIIPCNTAHTFLSWHEHEIKSWNLIHMIEIVATHLSILRKKNTLILWTKTTIQSQIYQDALLDKNIDYCVPNQDEQKKITNVILNVLAWQHTLNDHDCLVEIIQNHDCDSVILWCTELPLILTEWYIGKMVIVDTLQILAKNAFNFSICNL
jgi:aspartate racemase